MSARRETKKSLRQRMVEKLFVHASAGQDRVSRFLCQVGFPQQPKTVGAPPNRQRAKTRQVCTGHRGFLFLSLDGLNVIHGLCLRNCCSHRAFISK
jgi:hypothetical protein